MEAYSEEKGLMIELKGRIDSTNAEQFEKEIFEKCSGADKTAGVTLDANRLEYISSAGLRVLMKLKRIQSEIRVVNVSPEVYDIFEVTGFCQILDVKKKMRTVSIEGCEMISEGLSGKVYRLDPENIIKVYLPEVRFRDIERELNCSKQAFISGIPTAISYDIVKVGNAYGAVYEMLNAELLGARMTANPDKADFYIDRFTELALQLHHTDGSAMGLPKMKDNYLSMLPDLKRLLSEEDIAVLRRIIEAIPDRNTLIHGDLHTKNIMVQGEELMLIDLGDLSIGHPMIEVTNCYSVFVAQIEKIPERAEKFLAVSPEMAAHIWERFEEKYFPGAGPEAKKLIFGLCQLFALMRAVFATSKNPEMHEIFNAVFCNLKMNADNMISLMQAADPLFL